MLYYLQRILQLGPTKSIIRLHACIKNSLWKLYWTVKNRWIANPLCQKKIALHATTQHAQFFLQHSLIKSELSSIQKGSKSTIQKIDLLKNKKIILFNQLICLNDPDIWKKDLIQGLLINNQQIETTSIINGKKGEVRIAWELGRMHYLFDAAYESKAMINEEERKTIITFISEQIDDWQANNPFMKGIHWYNAMEVAIRATNLIFIAHLLEADLKKNNLWEKIIHILHQHRLFIKSHWETSITPNNHYLADLIGYGHLLLFFNEHPKKINRLLSQTLDAFTKQILPDGWAYEGSTGYHRLDTELLLHLTIMMEYTNHPAQKEASALFLNAYHHLIQLQGPLNNLPSIGDNDEGKILTGLYIAPSLPDQLIKHYPQMGISILNNRETHLVSRHAVFDSKSPTGHYHRDDLSILLAHKGTPILIDPGSGLYTGNPELRNAMRSFDAHNTLFCKDELDYDKKPDLFQLKKKEFTEQPIIAHQPDQIIITSKRPLYCTEGFIIRTIIYSQRAITITDQIVSNYPHEIQQTLIAAPEIQLRSENNRNTSFILSSLDTPIARLYGNIEWQQEAFYAAQTFGTLTPCQRLRMPTIKEKTTFSFSLIFDA